LPLSLLLTGRRLRAEDLAPPDQHDECQHQRREGRDADGHHDKQQAASDGTRH